MNAKQKDQKAMRAFSVHARLVARLQDLMDNVELDQSIDMPEEYFPMNFRLTDLTQGKTYAALEEHYNIPARLAILADCIAQSMPYQGRPYFYREFLCAAKPGADFSSVVPDFCKAMLTSLQEETAELPAGLCQLIHEGAPSDIPYYEHASSVLEGTPVATLELASAINCCLWLLDILYAGISDIVLFPADPMGLKNYNELWEDWDAAYADMTGSNGPLSLQATFLELVRKCASIYSNTHRFYWLAQKMIRYAESLDFAPEHMAIAAGNPDVKENAVCGKVGDADSIVRLIKMIGVDHPDFREALWRGFRSMPAPSSNTDNLSIH